MDLADPYCLTLTLELSGGPVIGYRDDFRAGSLDLIIWLRGVRLPGFSAGVAATVMDRDASPRLRDVDLPVGVLDELGALLRATGLPARALQVEGRVDTSDVWTELRLAVTWNDQPTTHVVVRAMSSGYDGPDAVALRALGARLLALVGSPHRLP